MNREAESNGANTLGSDLRISRRELLKGAGSCVGAAAIFSIVGSSNVNAQAKDASMPQVGDVFVFSTGKNKGNVISLNDLVVDAPPVVARAKDPVAGVERDHRTSASIVLLLRIKPETVPAELQTSAAQGVLAYSAWCTHLGCVIDQWDANKKVFKCPCHKSAFDPVQGGKVTDGPAPRPLPILPLKIVDDKPTVAGDFTARVGPQRS